MSRIRSLARDWLPPVLARPVQALRRDRIRFDGPFASWEEATAKSVGYDADNILAQVLDATLAVKRGEPAFERDSVLFDRLDYVWPVTAGPMWSAARANGRHDVLDFGGSLGSSYFQHTRLLAKLTEVRWSIVEQPHFALAGRTALQDGQLRFHESIGQCLTASRPNVILLSSVLQCLADPLAVIAEVRAVGAAVIIGDKTVVNPSPRDRIHVQHVPASIYRASYPCRSLSEPAPVAGFGPAYRLECAFGGGDFPQLARTGSQFRGFLLASAGQRGSSQ
jgi:putative methyltransferase (TIGR04325 family)